MLFSVSLQELSETSDDTNSSYRGADMISAILFDRLIQLSDKKCPMND